MIVSGTNRDESITEEGYKCRFLDKGEFVRRSTDPSLRDSAVGLGRDAVFLIAHWIAENDGLAESVRMEDLGTGGILVKIPNSATQFELTGRSPQEWVLSRLEFLDGDSLQVSWGYVFEDFRTVPGLEGRVAFKRNRFQVSAESGRETTDQSAVLESYEEPDFIGPESFRVDLAGSVQVHPRTGEVTGPDGEYLGKTTVRRPIGAATQWGTILGCAAAGLAVIAGGVVLARRHLGTAS